MEEAALLEDTLELVEAAEDEVEDADEVLVTLELVVMAEADAETEVLDDEALDDEALDDEALDVEALVDAEEAPVDDAAALVED